MRAFPSFVVAAAFAGACGTATRPSPAPRSVDVIPADLGDGWALSTPAAESIDPPRLSSLTTAAAAGSYGQIDALVIARNGRLCVDAYFNGTSQDVHEMQSVTKSVTSALVGAALARGTFRDVRAPLVDVLPEFAAAAVGDPGKRAIGIDHVLTMSAGLDWDETSYQNGDPRNTLTVMNSSADWVGFVTGRRTVEPPGIRFNYNSGGVILVGAALRAASGQDVIAFATDALFAPLGIRAFTWTRNPSKPEQVHAGGGLSLRARDAAKFGELYLDDGVWRGVRLLPAAWIHDSFAPRVAASDGARYGYLWWLRTSAGGDDVAEAWGTRGQHIFVVPARRLVVVVTARDNQVDGGRRILEVVLDAASR
jgi:CubicO group peptidase (beta-lactamase class C family)